MSGLKEGDRVVLRDSVNGGSPYERPAGIAGTVLCVYPDACTSLEGTQDAVDVRWDEHNPPIGYDHFPAFFLVRVEDSIPPDWLDDQGSEAAS